MPKRLLLPVRTKEGQVNGYFGIPTGFEFKMPKTWQTE